MENAIHNKNSNNKNLLKLIEDSRHEFKLQLRKKKYLNNIVNEKLINTTYDYKEYYETIEDINDYFKNNNLFFIKNNINNNSFYMYISKLKIIEYEEKDNMNKIFDSLYNQLLEEITNNNYKPNTISKLLTHIKISTEKAVYYQDQINDKTRNEISEEALENIIFDKNFSNYIDYLYFYIFLLICDLIKFIIKIIYIIINYGINDENIQIIPELYSNINNMLNTVLTNNDDNYISLIELIINKYLNSDEHFIIDQLYKFLINYKTLNFNYNVFILFLKENLISLAKNTNYYNEEYNKMNILYKLLFKNNFKNNFDLILKSLTFINNLQNKKYITYIFNLIYVLDLKIVLISYLSDSNYNIDIISTSIDYNYIFKECYAILKSILFNNINDLLVKQKINDINLKLNDLARCLIDNINTNTLKECVQLPLFETILNDMKIYCNINLYNKVISLKDHEIDNNDRTDYNVINEVFTNTIKFNDKFYMLVLLMEKLNKNEEQDINENNIINNYTSNNNELLSKLNTKLYTNLITSCNLNNLQHIVYFNMLLIRQIIPTDFTNIRNLESSLIFNTYKISNYSIHSVLNLYENYIINTNAIDLRLLLNYNIFERISSIINQIINISSNDNTDNTTNNNDIIERYNKAINNSNISIKINNIIFQELISIVSKCLSIFLNLFNNTSLNDNTFYNTNIYNILELFVNSLYIYKIVNFITSNNLNDISNFSIKNSNYKDCIHEIIIILLIKKNIVIDN